MPSSRSDRERPIVTRLPAPLERRAQFHVLSSGFGAVMESVMCAAIYVTVLFTAVVVAGSLGAYVPGIAGVILLIAVGFGLIAVAPEIANWVCNAVLDAQKTGADSVTAISSGIHSGRGRERIVARWRRQCHDEDGHSR